MFLSVNEAIKALKEVTGQNCNEITLLHYIWNGYLDLYICTNETQKIDIVSVGYYGYQCDDEWFVYNLEKSCEGAYIVKVDDLKASELLGIFENESLKIKITSAYKSDSKHIERAFLSRKAESSMSTIIKEFYENGSDELIDICEIDDSLGLGLYFNKFHFSLDEDQISNLKSNKTSTPKNAGRNKKQHRQDKIKEVVLWLAKKYYIADETLTNEGLAIKTMEHLEKHIDKLRSKKEKWNIQGEIVLPRWDTVRRWQELIELMDEINPNRKK